MDMILNATKSHINPALLPLLMSSSGILHNTADPVYGYVCVFKAPCFIRGAEEEINRMVNGRRFDAAMTAMMAVGRWA